MSKLRYRLYIFRLLAIIYFIFTNSNKLSAQSTGGKVNYTIIRNYVNTSEDVKNYTFDVLYLDSTIILQYNVIEYNMRRSFQSKDTAILTTRKFIYFDLKTLRCQDYKFFDTSSIPISNYQLKKGESSPLWNFYYSDTFPVYKISPKLLPDTAINNKVYKRLLFQQVIGSRLLERICYLTIDNTENLFHLSRNIDSAFKPLKFTRYEDYRNGKLDAICYYEHVSKKLSDFELSVFAKWKEYSITTNLPLQTQDEVFKSRVY